MTKKYKILVVDDEIFNLDILTDYLTDGGYDVIGAEDGVIALEKLEQNLNFDVIILDRMMPNMDGMEVLKRLKSDDRFSDIPVIMQTASALSEQILQGIQGGVYYYLTKPYDEAVLLSIVKSALQDAENKREMKSEVIRQKRVLGLMERSVFRFRTLEETKNLSYFIANCFPDPQKVVYGISELLINAVEHGNLGITYVEKTQLVSSGDWRDEVERRLILPENINKFSYLTFDMKQEYIELRVKDQGSGFDWDAYMQLTPSRSADPNGRGIAMANMLSFDKMEYIGCGNEVVCSVKLPLP